MNVHLQLEQSSRGHARTCLDIAPVLQRAYRSWSSCLGRLRPCYAPSERDIIVSMCTHIETAAVALTIRRSCGLLRLRSKSIELYPSTRPIPRREGTRYVVPPWQIRLSLTSLEIGKRMERTSGLRTTYSRSITLAMWSAIVASVPKQDTQSALEGDRRRADVPMPFLSISPTRSASVRYFGLVVSPFFSSQTLYHTA